MTSPGPTTAAPTSPCRRSTPRTPTSPGLERSNLGMYRVQLAGGRYRHNREVGLHYQIHRGIGAPPCRGHPPQGAAAGERLRRRAAGDDRRRRHAPARRRQRTGLRRHPGPPPRPHDLPAAPAADLRRGRLLHYRASRSRQALPEGPFGDHLGYYSLAHEFPVLTVERVYHRPDAIWPFTVVGRPPQEDAMFARLIHELAGPVIPRLIPGVRAVNAVEAAGVHPLLLAAGQRTLRPLSGRAAAAGTAHLGQRPARTRPVVAGQVPLDRRRRGRPGPRRLPRPRFLPAHVGAGGLAARPALPDVHDDRYARLQRYRLERRLEG